MSLPVHQLLASLPPASDQVREQFSCHSRCKHATFALLHLYFGAQTAVSYMVENNSLSTACYGLTFVVVAGLHAYDARYGDINRVLQAFQRTLQNLVQPVETLRENLDEMKDVEMGLGHTLEETKERQAKTATVLQRVEKTQEELLDLLVKTQNLGET